MTLYIIRRVIEAVPVLIGISIISFLIVQAAPGDPVTLLSDVNLATPEQIEVIKEELGLNQPVFVQYARMMSELLTGGLRSFRTKQSTMQMLMDALPVTLLLMGLTLLIALPIAIILGVISAVRANTRTDDAVMIGALFGISVPNFWLGLIFIMLFAEFLGWFPAGGFRPIGSRGFNPIEIAPYLVLPVAVMAMSSVAGLARYVRSGMLDNLGQDYVRTARAKGLRERVVIYRHALRNSLITVVTLVGVLIPIMLSGSSVIESVFAVPGVGRLAVSAALTRDYPLVLTINFFAATLVVFFNLLTDIVYGVVDPRVKVHQ
jgi:peptide/nickel transport system permease protein